MKKTILAISILLLGWAAPLPAEIMTYQGRLKDNSLPANGNYAFAFDFCDAAQTACFASTDNPQDFLVANGLFKSTFTMPSVDLSAQAWYLRVSVGGSVLSPMERLTAVPYAVYASSASYSPAAVQKAGDTMTGGLVVSGSSVAIISPDTVPFSLWASTSVTVPHLFVSTQGRVGVGTVMPASTLEVKGTARVLDQGDAPSLYFAQSEGNIPGVNGYSAGITGVAESTARGLALKTQYMGSYAERVRVTGTGNVGISTGAPQARLDVLSEGGGPSVMAQIWRDSSGLIVSSVSSTGVLQAVRFIGDGSGITGVTGAVGVDASKLPLAGGLMAGDIDMGGHDVLSAGKVSADYYAVNGTTVIALLPGIGSVSYGPAAGLSDGGAYNLFVGSAAGRAHLSGIHNVMLGYGAGYSNTTGTGNTFLGSSAGMDNVTGLQNIVIGYNQQTSASNAVSELNIGGVIFGQLGLKTIGISTRVPQAALDIVSTGTAGNIYTQFWRDSSGVLVASMSSVGHLQAARFVGDGSGLTGVTGTDATKLPLAGGTLTGNLLVHDSTLSITGGGLSVSSSGAADVGIYADIGGGHIWTNSGHPLYLGSGGTNRMVVDVTGNIGVNKTGPLYHLDVAGTGAFSDQVIAGGTVTVLGNAFSVGGSTLVVQNGNVGIGVQTPGQKLTLPYSSFMGWEYSFSNHNVAHFIGKTSDGAGPLEFRTTFNPGPTGQVYNFRSMSAANAIVVLDNGNVGISTGLPQGRLDVAAAGTLPDDQAQIWRNSAGAIVSSVSATGQLQAVRFIGDGSGLTNVAAATGVDTSKVSKAGDTMTGPLQIHVGADPVAFQVGISTLVVKNGTVGINEANPLEALHLGAGNIRLAAGQRLLWDSNDLSLYADGLGMAVFEGGVARLSVASNGGYGTVGAGDFSGVGIDTTSALHVVAKGLPTGDGRVAVFGDLRSNGSVAGQYLAGGNFEATVDSPDNAEIAVALRAKVRRESTGGNGTVNNAYGLMIDDIQNDAGTIAKTYGVYIGDQSNGTQTQPPFALYSADQDARSYFAGSLGLGTESPLGTLQVSSNTNSQFLVGGADTRFSPFEPLMAESGSLMLRSAQLAGIGSDTDIVATGRVTGCFNSTISLWTRPNGCAGVYPVRRMIVDNNGNVGISTFTPQARLDVLASGTDANTMAQIWRNSTGAIVSSVSATGQLQAVRFIGDGSGLAGVIGADPTKLPLAGGALTGNLGIGTGSPAHYLHLSSNTATPANTLLKLEDTGSGAPQLLLEAGGHQGRMATAASNGGTYIGTLTNDFLVFQTNSAEQMRIAADGKIGTGGIIPTEALDIANRVRISTYAGNVDTDGFYSYGLNGIRFESSGGTYLRVANGGANVGLGGSVTSGAGEAKLQVKGSLAVGSSISGQTADGVVVQGRVGIGTSVPGGLLEVRDVNALSDYLVVLGTGSAAGFFSVSTSGVVGVGYGNPSTNTVLHAQAIGTNFTAGEDVMAGLIGSARAVGTGSEDVVVGGDFHAEADGNQNLGFLAGLHTEIARTSAGTGVIDTAVGLYIEKPRNDAGPGGFTNTYGLYIDTQTSGAQANLPYSIYAVDSAARSYFAGKTGIANANPTYDLDIGDGTTGTTRALRVWAGGGGADTASMYLRISAIQAGLTLDASASNLTFTNSYTAGSDTFGGYIFKTGGTDERMRLTKSGYLGIGTAAPRYRLELSSAAGSADDILVVSTGTDVVFRVTGNGDAHASRFIGDGSGLVNVPMGGGALTEPLSINADTMAYPYELITTGLVISTGGAIQTTGVGNGIFSGNARGNGAVDLQTVRTAAAQVASGAYSSIGGGGYNVVSGSDSVIAGGAYNTVTGTSSVVAGGERNSAYGMYAGVLGGNYNRATNPWATVAGGYDNEASNTYAYVGGGRMNRAQGDHSTVVGGFANAVQSSGIGNSILGGAQNNINAGNFDSVIGGGELNIIYNNGSYGVITGGFQNYIYDYGWYSAVAGGAGNRIGAYSHGSSVGGGGNNRIYGSSSTIAGGGSNVVSSTYSFIGGGYSNSAGHNYSAIGGGMGNATGPAADYAFLGGGYSNQVNGVHASLGGGWFNVANGMETFLGGGGYNTVDNQYGVIAGGQSNKVIYDAYAGFIGGGAHNISTAPYSVVAGGLFNTSSGTYSAVLGGHDNQVYGISASIGGGEGNMVSSDTAVLAGGYHNVLMGQGGFIGGGWNNENHSLVSVVSGGNGNIIYSPAIYAGIAAGQDNAILDGDGSVIGGGYANSSWNDYTTISGGLFNYASGYGATVAGGANAAAAGQYAVVMGGNNNSAIGDYSFAAGSLSSSTANGTFTWNDSTAVAPLLNSVPDQVMFRASGGFWVSTGTVYTDPALFVTANNTVGIGVMAPIAKLDVRSLTGNTLSAMSPSASGTDGAVYGWTTGAATAIKGVANGTGYAGRFEGKVFVTDDGVNPANPAKLQVNGDLGLGDGTTIGNAPMVIWLTAASAVADGDIVVASGGNQFSITVTPSDYRAIGVVVGATAGGSIGKVAVGGVAVVNCTGATAGQHATTSATGGVAAATNSPTSGTSIGQFLTSCGTPSANKAYLLMK